uniref:Uncharacterized protein n=1 Tax=Branchiostoma floridae TaxID=7739 RepID=C3XPF8_BRAFL|eukprot:XP_002613820.1 hypothetical protein BRAFLDRAFT_72059 [Branchiostoma floridae]
MEDNEKEQVDGWTEGSDRTYEVVDPAGESIFANSGATSNELPPSSYTESKEQNTEQFPEQAPCQNYEYEDMSQEYSSGSVVPGSGLKRPVPIVPTPRQLNMADNPSEQKEEEEYEEEEEEVEEGTEEAVDHDYGGYNVLPLYSLDVENYMANAFYTSNQLSHHHLEEIKESNTGKEEEGEAKEEEEGGAEEVVGQDYGGYNVYSLDVEHYMANAFYTSNLPLHRHHEEMTEESNAGKEEEEGEEEEDEGGAEEVAGQDYGGYNVYSLDVEHYMANAFYTSNLPLHRHHEEMKGKQCREGRREEEEEEEEDEEEAGEGAEEVAGQDYGGYNVYSLDVEHYMANAFYTSNLPLHRHHEEMKESNAGKEEEEGEEEEEEGGVEENVGQDYGGYNVLPLYSLDGGHYKANSFYTSNQPSHHPFAEIERSNTEQLPNEGSEEGVRKHENVDVEHVNVNVYTPGTPSPRLDIGDHTVELPSDGDPYSNADPNPDECYTSKDTSGDEERMSSGCCYKVRELPSDGDPYSNADPNPDECYTSKDTSGDEERMSSGCCYKVRDRLKDMWNSLKSISPSGVLCKVKNSIWVVLVLGLLLISGVVTAVFLVTRSWQPNPGFKLSHYLCLMQAVYVLMDSAV